MTISVIVPAHQAERHLPKCLASLADSTVAPLEILVIDDGSDDGTETIAHRAGATVVRVLEGPAGPAAARNLGAAVATGDVLVFVDADVAVHPDTLEKFAACLEANPDVAAVFGSYDDDPEHPGFVSQYRNLLHHFVHQHGRREASTFWAGCGAVRRSAFEAVGGFDERYRRATIEDIELGGRLRREGYRVWLRPDIQAGHLKSWYFFQTVRSDIVDRAIPWTRLILRKGQLPTDLNTAVRSRVSAGAAWFAVAAAGMATLWPAALWGVLAGVAGLALLNVRLYRFFLERRGVGFAAGSALMHGLYLLYSSAVFGGLATSTWFARRRLTASERRADVGEGRYGVPHQERRDAETV